jgi:hypothetical protein
MESLVSSQDRQLVASNRRGLLRRRHRDHQCFRPPMVQVASQTSRLFFKLRRYPQPCVPSLPPSRSRYNGAAGTRQGAPTLMTATGNVPARTHRNAYWRETPRSRAASATQTVVGRLMDVALRPDGGEPRNVLGLNLPRARATRTCAQGVARVQGNDNGDHEQPKTAFWNGAEIERATASESRVRPLW